MPLISIPPRLFFLLLSAFVAAEPMPANTPLQQRETPVDWPARVLSLGGPAPAQSPIRFGDGSISRPDRYEYGSTFTPDGSHFFFGVDLGHRAEIRVCRWQHGRWSEDEAFLSSDIASYNDPMMSTNGERLYFITDQEGRDGGFDIAYVERMDTGWSDVQIASDLSTATNEYFWSETRSGEQFFARDTAAPEMRPNFDIFSQGPQPGTAAMSLPAEVNSRYYEGDPFVSAEGTWLIFVSNRPGGAGRGDLYVSHKAANGQWQPASAMGGGVNTPGHEITPYVTPDGRWLLFSRDGDIHWVSAQLLDQSQE
jgi:Tol biopolymer transport system component